MTTIKCPICKERVSGTSSMDLNEGLRDHMAYVHNMRELAPARREGVYNERSPNRGFVERRPVSGIFEAPESRLYREVETWTNRDPRRFDDRNYIPREEVRQWRYPITGPTGERGPYYSERKRMEKEPVARPETYREENIYPPIGVSNAPELNCPVCGTLIRGRDDEELSDELRFHMAEVHDVRQKIMAQPPSY